MLSRLGWPLSFGAICGVTLAPGARSIVRHRPVCDWPVALGIGVF
jgi:hypothetical protein